MRKWLYSDKFDVDERNDRELLSKVLPFFIAFAIGGGVAFVLSAIYILLSQ